MTRTGHVLADWIGNPANDERTLRAVKVTLLAGLASLALGGIALKIGA